MNGNPEKADEFFITAYFVAGGNRLHLIHYADGQKHEMQVTVPRNFELPLDEVQSFLDEGPVKISLRDASAIPPPLLTYTRQLGCDTAAYVPILQKGQLRGFVLIGARAGQEISEEVIEAFSRTIRLTANSLEFPDSPTEPLDDRRALERKALDALATNAATVDDLRSFYISIHDQVRSVIGNYGFVIALIRLSGQTP